MSRLSAFRECIDRSDEAGALHIAINSAKDPSVGDLEKLAAVCPRSWIVDFAESIGNGLGEHTISILTKRAISMDVISIARAVYRNPNLTKRNVKDFYEKCPEGWRDEINMLFKDHMT